MYSKNSKKMSQKSLYKNCFGFVIGSILHEILYSITKFNYAVVPIYMLISAFIAILFVLIPFDLWIVNSLCCSKLNKSEVCDYTQRSRKIYKQCVMKSDEKKIAEYKKIVRYKKPQPIESIIIGVQNYDLSTKVIHKEEPQGYGIYRHEPEPNIPVQHNLRSQIVDIIKSQPEELNLIPNTQRNGKKNNNFMFSSSEAWEKFDKNSKLVTNKGESNTQRRNIGQKNDNSIFKSGMNLGYDQLERENFKQNNQKQYPAETNLRGNIADSYIIEDVNTVQNQKIQEFSEKQKFESKLKSNLNPVQENNIKQENNVKKSLMKSNYSLKQKTVAQKIMLQEKNKMLS